MEGSGTNFSIFSYIFGTFCTRIHSRILLAVNIAKCTSRNAKNVQNAKNGRHARHKRNATSHGSNHKNPFYHNGPPSQLRPCFQTDLKLMGSMRQSLDEQYFVYRPTKCQKAKDAKNAKNARDANHAQNANKHAKSYAFNHEGSCYHKGQGTKWGGRRCSPLGVFNPPPHLWWCEAC